MTLNFAWPRMGGSLWHYCYQKGKRTKCYLKMPRLTRMYPIFWLCITKVERNVRYTTCIIDVCILILDYDEYHDRNLAN